MIHDKTPQLESEHVDIGFHFTLLLFTHKNTDQTAKQVITLSLKKSSSLVF